MNFQLHHNDGKIFGYIHTKIRTAIAILEFMIKHSGKKFETSYDEESYYKYRFDVFSRSSLDFHSSLNIQMMNVFDDTQENFDDYVNFVLVQGLELRI